MQPQSATAARRRARGGSRTVAPDPSALSSVPRVADVLCGKVLGSGSFGTVRAGVTSEGRSVALKSFNSDEGAAQELAVLAAITQHPHPGLLVCLGRCVVDCEVHAVLELMPGGGLDEVLQRCGALPEHVLCRYLEQVTGALAHLHSIGIMHLDVKAANLLLSTAEPEPTSVVKLADYGESTRVGAPVSGTKGTFTHMSPDAAGGCISPACDVWSLAVVGLEVVHGGADEWWQVEHGSVADNTFAGVLAAMRRVQPPAVPESLHPLTQSFLRSCLQIDPSDRPSAKELVLDEWFVVAGNLDAECSDSTELETSPTGGGWDDCLQTARASVSSYAPTMHEGA